MKNSNIGFSVKLHGGLGNQLFQYFAGKYFSVKSGIPVNFDCRWVKFQNIHEESDICDFKFTNNDEMLYPKRYGVIRHNLDRGNYWLSKQSRSVAELQGLFIIPDVYFAEEIRVRKNSSLLGYFQCRKYFEQYQRFVGTVEWDLNHSAEERTKLALTKFDSDFTVIHVRGRDFLNHKTPNISLTIEYYKKAFQMLKIEPKSQIVVFTDDIHHAKKLFADFPNLEFASQLSLSAAETLVIMSQASNLITSNSTLSYWSALISNANIVAPSKWTNGHENIENLYPLHWEIISV